MIIGISMSLLIAGLLGWSLTERRINYRHALRLEAKNAAEALVEYGFAQLRYKFDNQTSLSEDALKPGSPDALKKPPAEIFSPHVETSSIELIGGVIPPIMEPRYIDPNDPANEFDPLKGKVVLAKDISIFGKASVTSNIGGPPITSYVTQRLSVRDAPLFAHAIFYNLDLELFPGPEMHILGPVHTNGDLYVASQGSNTLNFHGITSVAGNVYHAWKNGVRGNNNSETLGESPVRFINRDGDLINMKVGGVWMDSTMGTGDVTPDFRSYASNTWHGNLQTQAHGIQNYKPVAFPDYEEDNPATPAYDPVNSGHDIIEPPLPPSHPDYNAEREAQKIANKACLYFKVSSSGHITGYKKDGTPVAIPDGLFEYKPNQMKDRRRGFNIDLVDVNMGKFKQLIESPDSSDNDKHFGNFDPATEWNGIVYMEFTSSDPELGRSGVRLYNGRVGAPGQGIPSRGSDPGFSFATNNCLYVRGDFNADGNMPSNSSYQPEAGEVPVALYGDAVTILSNNWDDDVSKTKNKPRATHTEVSAAIVTGLIPTGAGGSTNSSGGAHNLPRFLEKWSGKNLYIRGSLVALYECEVDDSPWSCNYYSPPRRLWGFNKLFAQGIYPPGTPLLRTYRRIDFRDMTEAEYTAAIQTLPWNGSGS
ncbi:MAG: hypothetical protein D6781_01675 [Verrucomicrobia bacterium]|nr:MAG: hypothetical protein D6781_01675 [Verrucomicrobiota bacterium]